MQLVPEREKRKESDDDEKVLRIYLRRTYLRRTYLVCDDDSVTDLGFCASKVEYFEKRDTHL